MNVVNKAGRTSLHVAVCKQHADCVRVLLKYRCDVNVQVQSVILLFHLYLHRVLRKQPISVSAIVFPNVRNVFYL